MTETAAPAPRNVREPVAPSHAHREWVPGRVLLPVLVMLLVTSCIIAAGVGAYSIAPAEVLGSIAHHIGLGIGPVPDALGDDVLWEIRFPRVVLAVIVGASLGCAGASMQGSFSNPLAEPGVVGVSAGAAVGAVAQIVLGFSFGGTWSTVFAAFVGGLITVLLVYSSARSNGRTEVVTLVLVGIAVNALTGAVIGLLTFYSNDAELRSITFWSLGSLAQATWAKVVVVAPIAIVGITLANIYAKQLDVLSLGERTARHLGVNVERLRISMLVVVAILTASAVAVSGIIQFVGLVIPHIVRGLSGPGHRLLMPASALAGAIILVIADLVARTIASPAEVPLGVLTALVGSPFFLWQLRRTRSSQGGWA